MSTQFDGFAPIICRQLLLAPKSLKIAPALPIRLYPGLQGCYLRKSILRDGPSWFNELVSCPSLDKSPAITVKTSLFRNQVIMSLVYRLFVVTTLLLQSYVSTVAATSFVPVRRLSSRNGSLRNRDSATHLRSLQPRSDVDLHYLPGTVLLPHFAGSLLILNRGWQQ